MDNFGGGLFDFDRDGATTTDEKAVGFMVLDEAAREKKTGHNRNYDSVFEKDAEHNYDSLYEKEYEAEHNYDPLYEHHHEPKEELDHGY